jgi:folate-binding protein YgfZ
MTTSGSATAALHHGAGLTARAFGVLWITGADALDLLNRLTTNKLESLPEGTSRATVLTNGDGRVLDLLHLGALDGGLWCLTSPGRAEAVVEWLDTFTFGEDITVTPRTDEVSVLTLAGPRAAETLAAAGVHVDALAPGALAHAAIDGPDCVVWRYALGPDTAFDVLVDAGAAGRVSAALQAAGAAAADEASWEAYRIACGIPAYGAEYGAFNNPLEARLEWAISDDKGCYTGQEVIARLQTYRKVQRLLMAVHLSGPAPVGAVLRAGDTEAGALTSVAAQPDGAWAALALVRTAHATPGISCTVEGAPTVTATLAVPAAS